MARVPESVVQQHIVKTLTAVGGHVYVLGTRRKGVAKCPRCKVSFRLEGREHFSTRQTPGISDLVAILPAPKWLPRSSEVHTAVPKRVLLFVEAKAAGGKLSPDQKVFRALCLEAAVEHVVGDLDAVIAWLMQWGYLKAEHVPHYRLPKSE